MTMPTAAVKLPLRAPFGELSCFKPRMKSTAASRYASVMTTVTARAFDERFGAQTAQMLGAVEHRSERIRQCASEERRPQRRRCAGWAPKIRRRSRAVTVCSFLGLSRHRGFGRLATLEHLEHPVCD